MLEHTYNIPEGLEGATDVHVEKSIDDMDSEFSRQEEHSCADDGNDMQLLPSNSCTFTLNATDG